MDDINIVSHRKEFDFGFLSKERGKIMGIAAIMIVVFHFSQMSNFYAGIASTVLNTFCGGVEMFALMSGIGLYYSYSKNSNFKQYYVKRICNVYLIYLIISLPFIIWWSIVNKEVNLLLVNWLLPSYITGYAREVWYVPFAMVMYLLYPIIYKILFNEKIYKYRFLLVSVFSVVWYIAYYFLYNSANSYFNKIDVAFFRFPIFLIGCLLGELVSKKEKCKTALIAMPIVSVVLTFCAHKFIGSTPGFRFRALFATVVYLAVIVLFFFFVQIKFIDKFFEFFGSISLELYLTHMLIYKVMFYYGIDNWIYYILAAIVSVIISYPLSKLRGKFVQFGKKRLSMKTNS